MRQWAVTMLLLLAGCATLPSVSAIYPTERTFAFPYDKVWSATVAALETFPVSTIEKDSGFIGTDWIAMTATKDHRQKIGWHAPVGADVRCRLNVRVAKIDDRSASVKVTNYSEALGLDPLATNYSSWRPIQTETVVEHQILGGIASALGVPAPASAASEVLLPPDATMDMYFNHVRALVAQAAAESPTFQHASSGSVTVSCVVARNGDVSDIKIAESSGNGTFESEAIKIIRESAPFPPLPSSAKEESKTIIIPLSISD